MSGEEEVIVGGDKEAENNEQTYPSVGLAYNLAVTSSDAIVRRLDSIDSKLQTILGFAAGITAGVPAIGGARGVSFNSIWFYLAAIAMVAAVILGIYARLTGEIKMLNPTELYQKWLYLSEWEFKKEFIRYAGKAFEANSSLSYRKWRLTIWVSIILFLEAICLAVWVVARHP
jgi:hypothetical protein